MNKVQGKIKEEISVIWHSRAGQGAVTAANTLATILGEEGKYVQSFPEFGAEKRGAPVKVFNRISDSDILKVSIVRNPDFVILLDTSLAINELSYEEITKGMTNNSVLLINTSQDHTKFEEIFDGNIFHCDASKISLEEIGRDIPNVPILSAFLGIAHPENDSEAYLEKIRENLSDLPGKIIEGNLLAFKRGFKEVKKIQ